MGHLQKFQMATLFLKYYVDTTTHEIILSFLGKVQMEVICAILEEKYHVEAEIKEPTVIYMERPLRKAEYTIHIEYLSRAYHDAPRYCADIVSTQIKNDEVILKGEIPARCIQEYRNDLTYFTNGQGVCLTELKGYQPAIGKFIRDAHRCGGGFV